uniref:Uncharacterized protein n=1 Tax=Opuntia streptacantha TaxID=393608 RepID=A0A7C9E000_OPUST
MQLVKRGSALQKCIFHVIPAFHGNLVLTEKRVTGQGEVIPILSEVLANWREAVKPLNPAIVEGLKRAGENRVAGKEAEHAIQHGRSLRVLSGELCHNLGR